jgi:hypothetical protein
LMLAGTNTYSGGTTNTGGALLVNGIISTNVVAVSGGILGGSGVIRGPVTVQTGGTLAPGSGVVGTLAVSNSLTLAAGSATVIRISKTGNTTTNDAVTGTTTLNYGGTLTVTNTGFTALAGGDMFKVFSAASMSGTFSTVNLPALAPGLYWTNLLAVNGTLAVVTGVSTVSTNIVWNFAGGNLSLAWPADHTGWRLLVQTGGLSGGISLNTNDWMTVAGSQQTNQVVVPVDATAASEFYKLVFP